MRIIVLKVCSVIFAFNTFSHAAGIQIGRTRVIYDANKKEVALSLTNTEKELPWLIQSWIDTGDGKTRGPFIVTPPLFQARAAKRAKPTYHVVRPSITYRPRIFVLYECAHYSRDEKK